MAIGQGPVYDDSITFATNKSDGGVATDPQHLTATEANAIGTMQYATRTAIRTGIYHGVADQSASLPPLSPAGGVSWTSNGGQDAVSENGGPWVWRKAVDYVNPGDKRFAGGCKGDASTANDAAFAAALAYAQTSTGGSNYKTRVLRLPEGIFRITQPLTLGSGAYGPIIEGNGYWDSVIYLDPATPNADGLTIVSSQNSVLEGFGIQCRAANPTGRALFYSYSSILLASSGHKVSDVQIFSTDGRGAFDKGIYFSDLYGNNSENVFFNVTVEGYKTCALALPGSQQYGNSLYSCNFNGLWDQVTPGVNGGLYGIWAGPGVGTMAWAQSTAFAAGKYVVANGNFYTCTTAGTSASSGSGPSGTGTNISDGTAKWNYVRAAGSQGTGCFLARDCNITNHAGADIRVDGLNEQPYVIDNLRSEGSYQTIGTGSAPTTGIQSPNNLVLRNSRISVDAGKYDTGGIINWNFAGTICIEDNQILATGSPSSMPLIRLAPGGATAGSIKRNYFFTTNSVATDPVVIAGPIAALNLRAMLDISQNRFLNASGQLAFRDEQLAIPSSAPFSGISGMGSVFAPSRAERLFTCDLTQFNAAATSQTINLNLGLPKGLTWLDFRALLYNYVTITGGAAVTMKVGTSSGGDQLLQATVLGTSGTDPDNTTYYGESSAQRGSAMQSSGGHMPAGSASSSVYVTLSVATGNLGNGTTSNITRGLIHFPCEYKVQPRYIA